MRLGQGTLDSDLVWVSEFPTGLEREVVTMPAEIGDQNRFLSRFVSADEGWGLALDEDGMQAAILSYHRATNSWEIAVNLPAGLDVLFYDESIPGYPNGNRAIRFFVADDAWIITSVTNNIFDDPCQESAIGVVRVDRVSMSIDASYSLRADQVYQQAQAFAPGGSCNAILQSMLLLDSTARSERLLGLIGGVTPFHLDVSSGTVVDAQDGFLTISSDFIVEDSAWSFGSAFRIHTSDLDFSYVEHFCTADLNCWAIPGEGNYPYAELTPHFPSPVGVWRPSAASSNEVAVFKYGAPALAAIISPSDWAPQNTSEAYLGCVIMDPDEENALRLQVAESDVNESPTELRVRLTDGHIAEIDPVIPTIGCAQLFFERL